MKFALIDNIKVEATKGAKGLCPNCGSELIAKCGDFKVNHWAHKGVRNCDPWWENETEWHRAWKGNFPTDWQEIILTDEVTGEKHIADVRNAHELVVEFQHSHIDPVERTTREKFYKKMVWVVDGTRLKKDYPRLQKTIGRFRLTKTRGIYLVDFIDECFPSAWLGSSVPVIFDFKGIDAVSHQNDERNYLYCLFPKINEGTSVVAIWNREVFINSIKTGELLKQNQGQKDQAPKPPVSSKPNVNYRPSQYVFDRGRFVKRKRF